MSAGVLWLAGAVLLSLADEGDSVALRLAAFMLMITPVALATLVTGRRRRRARREDSPDSVEHQAAGVARAQAFTGAIIVMGLVVVAQMYLPGPMPQLWSLAGFAALPVLFWVLYAVQLGRLRG